MNLFPGQGLGFQANKNMAYGLGYITGEVVSVPVPVPDVKRSGYVGGKRADFLFYDDGFQTLHQKIVDDRDVMEILTVIAATEVLE